MGWELTRLFSYQDGRGHDDQISSELRLCDVCRVGDHWQRRSRRRWPSRTGTYPSMVAGKYACPPEDCGGPWGYADMRRVLAGHRNARRRELVEWLGRPFDPKAFDIDEAREHLTEYVEVSMPTTQPVVV